MIEAVSILLYVLIDNLSTDSTNNMKINQIIPKMVTFVISIIIEHELKLSSAGFIKRMLKV